MWLPLMSWHKTGPKQMTVTRHPSCFADPVDQVPAAAQAARTARVSYTVACCGVARRSPPSGSLTHPGDIADLAAAASARLAVGTRIDSYARPVTVAELSLEMGIDAGDIEVMIAALGVSADSELTAAQTADLLDVLDAKVRLRR